MEPYIIEPAFEEEAVFQHEGEEFMLVLEGRHEFIYDGKTYIMEKGDSVYFDAAVPHTGKSIGKKKRRPEHPSVEDEGLSGKHQKYRTGTTEQKQVTHLCCRNTFTTTLRTEPPKYALQAQLAPDQRDNSRDQARTPSRRADRD